MKLTDFLDKVLDVDYEARIRLWEETAKLAHITDGFGCGGFDWIEVEPALSELKEMIAAGVFDDIKA